MLNQKYFVLIKFRHAKLKPMSKIFNDVNFILLQYNTFFQKKDNKVISFNIN